MFLSMTIRNIWKADANGVPRIERETNYNSIMKKIADDEHLAFIDMASVEATPGSNRTGEDRAAVPHRPHPHQRRGCRAERAIGGDRARTSQVAAGGLSQGQTASARTNACTSQVIRPQNTFVEDEIAVTSSGQIAKLNVDLVPLRIIVEIIATGGARDRREAIATVAPATYFLNFGGY